MKLGPSQTVLESPWQPPVTREEYILLDHLEGGCGRLKVAGSCKEVYSARGPKTFHFISSLANCFSCSLHGCSNFLTNYLLSSTKTLKSATQTRNSKSLKCDGCIVKTELFTFSISSLCHTFQV